ncbi:MAG: hypothetical protein M3014_11635 [Chloroflexota bacterium]|nr:hypothetical protein [Chloroflexota bacterium]
MLGPVPPAHPHAVSILIQMLTHGGEAAIERGIEPVEWTQQRRHEGTQVWSEPRPQTNIRSTSTW